MNAQKDLGIASSLLRVLKHLCVRPVFLAIEPAILQICISNISFLSRKTPNNLRKVQISNSTPHKNNGGCCRKYVLDF